MNGFEFNIAKNMAANKGMAEGYFAVQSDYSGVSSKIGQCLYRLGDIEQDVLCIPVVTDEFGTGSNLARFLGNHEQFAGFLTFGADETAYSSRVPVQSHLDIITNEIGVIRPDFLSVLLEMPKPMSNSEWRRTKPLDELHLRYGRIFVLDEVCLLEATDEFPPLTD